MDMRHPELPTHRQTRKPRGLRRHPAAGIACMLLSLAAGLKANAHEPAAMAPAPRDVVLVIDASADMAGGGLARARAELERWLDGLAPTERFNIVSTGARTERLFPESAPAAPAYLDLARRYLHALDAEGEAELAAALQLARDGRERPGWERSVVVTGTDAGLHAAQPAEPGAADLPDDARAAHATGNGPGQSLTGIGIVLGLVAAACLRGRDCQ